MSKAGLSKIAGGLLAAVILVGVTVPYINAEGYRERIQSALERSLNRKVEVGRVRFNLFTGPGFTVEKVVISDDPSVGIEPLAYVEALEARVTLATLWTRELAFSNLKLKNPTVNLVKMDAGWNFQLLNAPGRLPSIQVRAGRINFKFGDTQSVFYLSESDLDVSPLDDTRVDVRFAGQPARTDQSALSFGQLLARGVIKRGQGSNTELDLNTELERSGISEIARILEGRGVGVHGTLSSKAHISGPISHLAITGQLKVEDVHRWDLVLRGGASQLDFRGQLDLVSQRLEVATAEREGQVSPLTIRLRAADLLSQPRWAASVDLHQVPAAALMDAARQFGAPLPDGVQTDGTVSGAVSYSREGGLQGSLSANAATIRAPGAPVLKFQSADVLLDAGTIRVGPSTVEAETGQTAELAGEYNLKEKSLDVRISTPGMNVGEMRKNAGVRVPALGWVDQGTWKGSLRYQQSPDSEGGWSGDVELKDVRLEVPGVADPVRLAAASVSLHDQRFSVTRMRGRVGAVPFTGEYRWEPAKHDRFQLEIPEAAIGELERIFLPTLKRQVGLLARFRLRPMPPPEWLRERRAGGSFKIARLTGGDQSWQVGGKVDWNGVVVKLTNVDFHQSDASGEAELVINLAAPVPSYRITGKIGGLAWKGGELGLEGQISANGTGLDALASTRAEGTFEGENLAFTPEMEFKSASGTFLWLGPNKLQLKTIQAAQGFEAYTGQGSTQPDGKLLLDLTSSSKHQVKVAGTLTTAPRNP